MKALSLLGITLIALAQATASAFAEEKAADAAKIDGEKIYKGLCMSCHDAGIAGSPKLGDKAAWEPRIATRCLTMK